MASSQLVWQLVKNYNCFLHKGLNDSQFSAEPGNLYNLNSYKYSGGAQDCNIYTKHEMKRQRYLESRPVAREA